MGGVAWNCVIDRNTSWDRPAWLGVGLGGYVKVMSQPLPRQAGRQHSVHLGQGSAWGGAGV